MAYRILTSNESPQGFVYEERIIVQGVAGNVTSDTSGYTWTAPPNFAGTIVSANLVVGQNGVDASNALQMALALTKNGTSIFTTAPVIAKAAGTGAKNTFASGTGITVPVLDSTQTAVTAGDVFKHTFDITRTASPSTEIADVSLVLVIRPTAGTSTAS